MDSDNLRRLNREDLTQIAALIGDDMNASRRPTIAYHEILVCQQMTLLCFNSPSPATAWTLRLTLDLGDQTTCEGNVELIQWVTSSQWEIIHMDMRPFDGHPATRDCTPSDKLPQDGGSCF